jgi:sterol desaturase/sphingolipid hydroxylase (fatty acid hydroxylase superfamily)
MTNTVGSFAACFLLREIFNYWVHRAFHSKILYQTCHAGHHAISHVGQGAFDGIYGHVIDSFAVMFGAFLPFLVLPETHALVIMSYFLIVGLFGFMINHCGREAIFVVTLPLCRRLVIYDNQHHDDHHTYRHGNYCDFIPAIDRLFGTDLVIEERRPLPAKLRWLKMRDRFSSQNENDTLISPEEDNHIESRAMKIGAFKQASFVARRSVLDFTERIGLDRLLEEHPDCLQVDDTRPRAVQRRKSVQKLE